jgi:predicted dehydrogenase
MAAAAAGLPVVAVASRSIERAEERAGQLGAAAHPYRDLPAGADAVVVATPPRAHLQFVTQAVAAGAAVLVEQPIATTLADADVMVAAEAAGGRILYGANLAFAPELQAGISVVQRWERADYLEVRALSPRPSWGDHLDPSWGGGALFDVGAQAVAVALLLAGDDRPVEVLALLSGPDDLAADDHAEVQLRFASGLVARIEASWRHHDTVWDLQASCPTEVVRADLLPRPALEVNGEPVTLGSTAPTGVDPHVFDLGYVAQIEALSTLARDGGPSPVPATFGRLVLDVVSGAYASAGSGGPVPLPFTGPRDRSPLELWRG